MRDPRRTPSRTPGVHSLPVGVELAAARRSHDSPGCTVVSAASSLPFAGSMIGPIWVVGSSGGPTFSDLDRIDELAAEPARRRDRADQDDEGCGRALLPGVAERRVRDILRGEVEVGARGDDDRVLAAGLGQQRQVRAERAEQLRRLVGAGEDDAIDPRVGDELLPERAVARGGRAGARRAGTPASHSASASTAPQRAACRAGLRMTPEPAASAASTPPAGIATGKFHGGVTTVSPTGTGVAPSTSSRPRAELRVVVGEVDRLGDLRVGLVDGLAGLGRHHLDELPAAQLELVGRALQDLGALGTGAAAPCAAGLDRPGDDGIQPCGIPHGVRGDRSRARASTPGRGRGCVPPTPGSRRRPSRCRRRSRTRRRRAVRGASNRFWMRFGRRHGVIRASVERRQEPVALAVEHALVVVQLEDRRT